MSAALRGGLVSLVLSVVVVLSTVACGDDGATPVPASPGTERPAQASPAAAASTPVPTTAPQQTPTEGPAPVSTTPTPGAGTLRFVLVPEESEARYRVREQLANRSLPNDAVGSTRAVSGVVVFSADGQVVPGESVFEVDLRTLRSDQSRRDNYIQENTLQTARFPMATFVPTGVSGLPWPLPESGALSFQLSGDLTLHGVTRPVTWEVTAQAQGDRVVGTATTQVTFEDFGMQQPRVAVVLSVEETITLELDFTVVREESS